MTGFSRSPRTLKGGLVLQDPSSGRVLRVITLQYNPDTLTRTVRSRAIDSEGGERADVLRLTGPPVETYRLEAEIDATDRLEEPRENRATVQYGIAPQLAALETVVYPRSDLLRLNHELSKLGILEVAPAESPLVLFVWSRQRVLPVRITELSITEEAFDTDLNPIRARVELGMRVLSTDDLGFDHRGSGLFMAHHRRLEELALTSSDGDLETDLGLEESDV